MAEATGEGGAAGDGQTEVQALRGEIARLHKVVNALINRAERDLSTRPTAFGMFQATVTLEQEVRERTRELEAALRENEKINRALQREKEEQRLLIRRLEEAHSQLLQSEKLASIGQLAAGVAHEINNPIGFISANLGALQQYVDDLLGFVDGLLVELEPYQQGDAALRERLAGYRARADFEYLREDVGKLIDESIQGTSRVRKIVQDLRDFSRTGEDQWEWADLHAGLESTINVLWNEIKYKAELLRDYGPMPRVECRPSQINQVFLNLLVNAAQAIPGHGSITVRTGSRPGWVWVAVQDSGCGIPADIRQRIFDPFFTTKPVGKGTGLGLSLSYGIVHKHGGHITVDSEPGQGSTFTVWLPEQRAAGAEQAGAAE